LKIARARCPARPNSGHNLYGQFVGMPDNCTRGILRNRPEVRTFTVQDPFGYQIWFGQNVAEPKLPAGAKVI
jgi:hypothetical protein